MTHPTRTRLAVGLLAALLAATFVIRAPITSVPPVLDAISADLHLSPVGAGLVTTLPLICFGVFAFVTPLLVARVGGERTLSLAVIAIALGIAARLVVHSSMFFAGALLIGLGIAIANVVIPAIARARFSGSLAKVMGLYTVMIQISGAAGAFLTHPLLAATGWGWPGVLALWLVPTGIALVWWAVASGRHTRIAFASPRTTSRLRDVVRRPQAWGVAVVMGLQSLLFYTLVNWLPTWLHQGGWSADAAGLALGSLNLLGMPGGLVGARILTSRRRTPIIGAVVVVYVVALGLLLLGGWPAGVGVVLAGLCQGPILAIALSAIAHQPDPLDVPAVSALAQGVGYLVAALGPVVVGALYGATSGFTAAAVALGLCVVVWGVVTVATTRSLARA